MSELAGSIETTRRDAGLTLAEMSSLTGLSRQLLTYIENGRSRGQGNREWLRPKPEQLRSLASALLVDPERWFLLAGYVDAESASFSRVDKRPPCFICESVFDGNKPTVFRDYESLEGHLDEVLEQMALEDPSHQYLLEVPTLVVLKFLAESEKDLNAVVLGTASLTSPESVHIVTLRQKDSGLLAALKRSKASDKAPFRVGVFGKCSLPYVALIDLLNELKISWCVEHYDSSDRSGDPSAARVHLRIAYSAGALIHDLRYELTQYDLMPSLPYVVDKPEYKPDVRDPSRVEQLRKVRSLGPLEQPRFLSDLPELLLIAPKQPFDDGGLTSQRFVTEFDRLNWRTGIAKARVRVALLEQSVPNDQFLPRLPDECVISNESLFLSEMTSLSEYCSQLDLFEHDSEKVRIRVKSLLRDPRTQRRVLRSAHGIRSTTDDISGDFS